MKENCKKIVKNGFGNYFFDLDEAFKASKEYSKNKKFITFC